MKSCWSFSGSWWSKILTGRCKFSCSCVYMHLYIWTQSQVLYVINKMLFMQCYALIIKFTCLYDEKKGTFMWLSYTHTHSPPLSLSLSPSLFPQELSVFLGIWKLKSRFGGRFCLQCGMILLKVWSV